jgi:hypothetical protein
MIVPMILGYAVGAIGMYTLLYNRAPRLSFEEEATHPVLTYDTEIIHLYASEEVRKAA